jgi:transposase-like protein
MTISTLTIDDNNLHNGAMNDPDVPNPEVLERSAGRRQFSAKYKAKILAEYDTLSRLGRGALLRREGLYSSLITTWREQRDRGAEQALARPSGRQKTDPRDREITRLTREVGRLEGELDTSRRVVEIQAKLSALLETLASTSTAESSEKK